MKNLLPGLRKFSERVFPGHQQHFESLVQGQKPHTLMITCSDSRIDPNLVTQTKPGELFVVRNAGNIIPPFGASRGGEEAAIEFAIEGLGVHNIVICGHSQCGAMAALVDRVNLDKLPCVKAWLDHAQASKKRIDSMATDFDLTHVIEENVLVQADNLRTHPSVSSALRSGRVQLFGWVYNFETGSVAVYDPQLKKFLPSTEVKEETEKDVSRFAL
jgi:carbonic anhydrase